MSVGMAGYPNGLCSEQIPLAARIVAIVDAYDALSNRRVCKAPLPHDDCIEVIRGDAGRHFDPVLVDVFLEIESEIRDISYRYSPEAPPAGATTATASALEHGPGERGVGGFGRRCPRRYLVVPMVAMTNQVT